MKRRWISIDWGGNECICFKTKKWKYTEDGETDYRSIKRDLNGVWWITDDYGQFVRYDRDGESTECLEHAYQEWLFEDVIEVELL